MAERPGRRSATSTTSPSTASYSICPEYAIALTDESSPAFLPGLFQIAHGTVRDARRIIELARTGDGLGWHDHNTDVHVGCERFFRPGYLANLVDVWLPALDGVVPKLQRGARVADIGCGHGASTVIMAQAYPASTFVGSDYHDASIATARERAAAAGLGDRSASRSPRPPASTVDRTTWSPPSTRCTTWATRSARPRQVYDALADDGTWMIVEPIAGDHVEDNLNPVGRVYYGFSTLLCTPASLSQSPGTALGTQAGPARIRDVTMAAGFTRFSTVASTPFNNVFEVRR